MKYSRSRDATLTLRNLALAERRAPKRTDGNAGLSPPNERSGTQPTSPEKLRQLHAARRLFRESLSQPHVVLGTPIPPTQQSTRRFRALAPSPPVQPTAVWLTDRPTQTGPFGLSVWVCRGSRSVGLGLPDFRAWSD
ncbi:hypothetical protein EDB81DRAFT_245975 [Dactylonectria macrodidyma]|uniref:Uncharacterized protein n=1 Tax=Dactylonectria macrodidyma TaxID=307937 RepID=A0A9P9DE37_9HYPO|nr:hypothetical protein EDB81DRAFT_245975 [Dactylonectria macrodidyma]